MRIRDFDEESEDHPGDQAVVDRLAPTTPVGSSESAAETAATPSPTTPVVVVEALKLKALGFTIIPVKTGSKDPSSQRWTEAATNDPAVFLRNPGTHNYGVLPPPGCFCWDVDKGVPEFIQAASLVHGDLPETRIHQSPHGQHWFFRWPQGYKRPTGPMFGSIVTRWPFGDKGQGYVVGPGSELVNGENLKYSVLWESDIADFPLEWAQAALLSKPPVEERERKPLAERELKGEGARHEYLRDQARFIYGKTGLVGADLFAAIWSIYLRDCVPYAPPLNPREEVERAIGDPTQFPRDEQEEEPTPPPTGPVFDMLLDTLTMLEENRLDPYLIDRFVVNNGLTIWAGHPKSMKSLALLQAGFSFAARTDFLGMESLGECYPAFLYVTEEGSRYETRERLMVYSEAYEDAVTRVMTAYMKEVRFDIAGGKRMSEALAAVYERLAPLAEYANAPLRVLMAMDPLRDFIPPGSKWSENDAQDMGRVKAWLRDHLRTYEWLSIVLVHHLRKAAENRSGLDMAGSGATYGATDSTIIWTLPQSDAPNRDDEDDPALAQVLPAKGWMNVQPRGDAAFKKPWHYNPVTRLFEREGVVISKSKNMLAIIRAAGADGITSVRCAEVLDWTPNSVAMTARRYRDDGDIVIVGGGGRNNPSTYYHHEFAPSTLDDSDDITVVDPIHTL